MVRLTFLSMIDILLVHDSGVRSLKPWKFKRPFQMHCWKAIDNHVQGVIDITLGKCFQGFKRIRNGLLQSSSTFLSIVFCSYTHWSCMDGTTSGLTSKKVSTPLRMCKYLHSSKYTHKIFTQPPTSTWEIPPFGVQLTSGPKMLKMARISERIQSNMLPENLGSHETAGGSTLGIKKMLCRLKNSQ